MCVLVEQISRHIFENNQVWGKGGFKGAAAR